MGRKMDLEHRNRQVLSALGTSVEQGGTANQSTEQDAGNRGPKPASAADRACARDKPIP